MNTFFLPYPVRWIQTTSDLLRALKLWCGRNRNGNIVDQLGAVANLFSSVFIAIYRKCHEIVLHKEGCDFEPYNKKWIMDEVRSGQTALNLLRTIKLRYGENRNEVAMGRFKVIEILRFIAFVTVCNEFYRIISNGKGWGTKHYRDYLRNKVPSRGSTGIDLLQASKLWIPNTVIIEHLETIGNLFFVVFIAIRKEWFDAAAYEKSSEFNFCKNFARGKVQLRVASDVGLLRTSKLQYRRNRNGDVEDQLRTIADLFSAVFIDIYRKYNENIFYGRGYHFGDFNISGWMKPTPEIQLMSGIMEILRYTNTSEKGQKGS